MNDKSIAAERRSMNITVNCTYDKKAITTFARSGLYKKADPRKRFIEFIAIALFCIAVVTLTAVAVGFDSKALILITLIALSLLCQFYVYLILPRIIFNARKNLGNVRQTLTFADDEIISLSFSDEFESTEKISYNTPVSIRETKNYVFFYITKQSAYIIDKSGISDTDLTELHKLFALRFGEKYTILNY